MTLWLNGSICLLMYNWRQSHLHLIQKVLVKHSLLLSYKEITEQQMGFCGNETQAVLIVIITAIFDQMVGWKTPSHQRWRTLFLR